MSISLVFRENQHRRNGTMIVISGANRSKVGPQQALTKPPFILNFKKDTEPQNK